MSGVVFAYQMGLDRVNDIDDVNEKIGKLIEIMIRGIEFKG